jgi:dTDP-glucose 4,6-dehydratase
LIDLAQKIISFSPDPIKIVTRTLGPNAPRASRAVPDISLAQKTLGLEIKTDLDTAIRLALQWYRILHAESVAT